MSDTLYWVANYVIISRADDLNGLLLLRNTTRAALEKGPPQYLLQEIDRLLALERKSTHALYKEFTLLHLSCK